MKKQIINLLIVLFSSTLFGQNIVLSGFKKSIYYQEQICEFTNPVWAPDTKIQINAPSAEHFDAQKPVELIFFALPNSNSTENTIGNIDKVSEDWHYDIQHIGAQTRFIRNIKTDANIVVCYVEAAQKSWGTWRTLHSDQLIAGMVDSVASLFSDYPTFITLNGHSGGGNWVFGYINSQTHLPAKIKRIAFLDSNYSYTDSQHGSKLAEWLTVSTYNALSVIAYNDSVALYNGEPVVSATGGTWYRSKLMVSYLQNHFTFTKNTNSNFWTYSALNNRISFVLKTNPEKAILHTVQVERNGFIHSIFSGTPFENQAYTYYPLSSPFRAYSNLIQQSTTLSGAQFPSRPTDAIPGSAFVELIKNMSLKDREERIFEEAKKGNMPTFCKTFKTVRFKENGHECLVEVVPDYFAIGSDVDFCRLPLSPEMTQKIGDYFSCSLPTTKMVDSIWEASQLRIQPITHAPNGNDNEQVFMFSLHNQEIETALHAQQSTWERTNIILGGLKKDLVISNKIIQNPNKVGIYGWHKLDGTFWQPLYFGHINTYMDYSHGIRLVNTLVWVDGKPMDIKTVLKDENLYQLLSNEVGIMSQPYYTYSSGEAIPGAPKSFGVKVLDENSVEIRFSKVSGAAGYEIYKSTNGVNYNLVGTTSELSMQVNDLTQYQLTYFKLKAVNSSGASVFSEALAIVPDNVSAKMLVIQGFDRLSAGNTFDFMKYHALALKELNVTFDVASNEAVQNALFLLTNYQYVDYVLGDESTIDETFSNAEQTILKNYLKSGGNLFVSGAEIAWDLDYKGSASDKAFYHDYLKSAYLFDSPNNISGVYYAAKGVLSSFFENLNFTFDNGNFGTINVKYPDQLTSFGGGVPVLEYSSTATTAYAGIAFSGIFPEGTTQGKVINLGFPFESVYPQSSRNLLMARIVEYFNQPTTSVETLQREDDFRIFPNPSDGNIKLSLSMPTLDDVEFIFYNLTGNIVAQFFVENNYLENCFDISLPLTAGIYFCLAKSESFSKIQKLIIN